MFKSIRWRLQMWHAAILIPVVASFAGILYGQQHHERMHGIDEELKAAAEILNATLKGELPATLQRPDGYREFSAADIETRTALANRGVDLSDQPLDGLRVPNTFARRPRNKLHEIPYFVVWRSDRSILKSSTSVVAVPFPDLATQDWQHRDGQVFRHRGEFQEIYQSGPLDSHLVVGRSTEPDRHDLRELLLVLIGTGISVLIIGLVGGWVLSSRVIQPITEIGTVAREISASNLSRRIDVAETDSELGTLAATLNDTFERLEAAFRRQTQFTADASHELRTPLAAALMQVELALSRPRTTDEYREQFQNCQAALQRLQSLVESLLTLARVDSSGSGLQTERVDIAVIAGECVNVIRPLADTGSINLSIDTPPEPVPIQGDRTRLTQAITNLLSNAVRHTDPDGRVSVSIRVDGAEVMLTVEDSGVGIPAESLPFIFDRFYRVESARTRDAGGSGLGLSICRTIVEAHHGTISVRSERDAGSTFELRFPRSTDDPPEQAH